MIVLMNIWVWVIKYYMCVILVYVWVSRCNVFYIGDKDNNKIEVDDKELLRIRVTFSVAWIVTIPYLIYKLLEGEIDEL